MKVNFKYIIVDSGAILFNEMTTHSIVAQGFKEVYAAGFCQVTFGNKIDIVCHGNSESLNIESQPIIDQTIIKDLFNPTSLIKYMGMQVKPFYKD